MIVFDPTTNHACLAVELRHDGKALYIDQIDGSRIICERESMNMHPEARPRRHGWPLKVHGPAFDLNAALRQREAGRKRYEATEKAINRYRENLTKSPIRNIRIVDPDGQTTFHTVQNQVA